MRLEESAARLETASTPAEKGEDQAEILENMRQELVLLRPKRQHLSQWYSKLSGLPHLVFMKKFELFMPAWLSFYLGNG